MPYCHAKAYLIIHFVSPAKIDFAGCLQAERCRRTVGGGEFGFERHINFR